MRYVLFTSLKDADVLERAEEFVVTDHGVMLQIGTQEILIPWHRVQEVWNP